MPFIPNHFVLLVCLIPLIVISDYVSLIPPLFTVGDARVRIYDLVLLVIAIKTVILIMVTKQRIYIHSVYKAVVIYMTILLCSTVVDYYKFDGALLSGEIIAFLRFLSQVSILFVLALSIRNQSQLKMSKILDYIGYFVAATVYLGFLFFAAGITFGEVIQYTEGGVRYFGPLGDQVGFVLLFFIYKTFLDRHIIGLLFLTGALLASGTRGAIVSLLIGLVVMGWSRREIISLTTKRVFGVIAVLAVFGSLMILFNVGDLRTRSTGSLDSTTLFQRFLTAKLAFRVWWDHPFIGVGYTGFRYVASDYGAFRLFAENFSSSPVHMLAPAFIATAGNQYLQVATDGGIVALVSFIWMATMCLRTLKSATRYPEQGIHNLCLAGYIWLVSLLIGNQTAAWMLPASLISSLLWLVLGLAVVIDQYYLESIRITLQHGRR